MYSRYWGAVQPPDYRLPVWFLVRISEPRLNVLLCRRYLQEYSALGTGGGIYHFRDQIVAGGPEAFFVMNADVCSAFPLADMLRFQKEHGEPSGFVILGTTVRLFLFTGGISWILQGFKIGFGFIFYECCRGPGNSSHFVFSVQQNPVHELWLHRGKRGHTRGKEPLIKGHQLGACFSSITSSSSFFLKVLHYVEKPSTFVSDIINCGVYLFTPDIFQHIGAVFQKNQQDMLL